MADEIRHSTENVDVPVCNEHVLSPEDMIRGLARATHIPYETARTLDEAEPPIAWDEEDYEVSSFARSAGVIGGARRIHLLREQDARDAWNRDPAGAAALLAVHHVRFIELDEVRQLLHDYDPSCKPEEFQVEHVNDMKRALNHFFMRRILEATHLDVLQDHLREMCREAPTEALPDDLPGYKRVCRRCGWERDDHASPGKPKFPNGSVCRKFE